ncbi:ABC transporter permease [Evansella sp. AB-P1]|uniref:ABC transporter permease n=1 Tax=Evansella sp. AB-P1 TaxID=3037653 RepID=UPI00241E7ECE|nr:ABC transporter permease [Evansella sp. AB-P1]MDG5787213.1 ABC transporter permease [Evansella sp. AB-P1]
MLLKFIGYRLLQLIPLLFVVSILVFFVIQLPPGDFITTYVSELENAGIAVSESHIQHLRDRYGLDQPFFVQYASWVQNIIFHGDLGRSFNWAAPVSEVISGRIGITMLIASLTLLFTWAVALPIGIFSAVRQYSVFDYIFTFIGFIGLAIPNFLIALIILFAVFTTTGVSLTGLFSPEFIGEPWSFAKFLDMLPRLWLPVVVVGTASTAALIRVTRAMLLDELQKQYVITARAKGVSEKKLLFKYPVRVAINPLISTIGWTLPTIIGGEIIVSIVLNLPTTGPMLLRALEFQDMYLAGGFLLIISVLTVIGTLISDILLAWLDPRIRFGGVEE